jgi:hypothetical protein
VLKEDRLLHELNHFLKLTRFNTGSAYKIRLQLSLVRTNRRYLSESSSSEQ